MRPSDQTLMLMYLEGGRVTGGDVRSHNAQCCSVLNVIVCLICLLPCPLTSLPSPPPPFHVSALPPPLPRRRCRSCANRTAPGGRPLMSMGAGPY